MGTSVFTWNVRYGQFREGFESRLDRDEASNGVERVRSYGPARFVVPQLTVITTDNTAGESLADWDTFWRTTLSNGADSFLFKARTPAYARVEGEALGTCTVPGTDTFALAKKFIDAATLVVYVGGVEQTVSTDYTLTTNNTAPTITTTGTFDTGAVTATYEFYYQVRATVSGYTTDFLQRGTTLALPGAQTLTLEMREVQPGGHLA